MDGDFIEWRVSASFVVCNTHRGILFLLNTIPYFSVMGPFVCAISREMEGRKINKLLNMAKLFCFWHRHSYPPPTIPPMGMHYLNKQDHQQIIPECWQHAQHWHPCVRWRGPLSCYSKKIVMWMESHWWGSMDGNVITVVVIWFT